jgi:hypothetical protein
MGEIKMSFHRKMNPIDDLFFGFFEIEFFMFGSDFLKIGIGLVCARFDSANKSCFDLRDDGEKPQ